MPTVTVEPESNARAVLETASDLLDVQCDPVQPTTAAAVDAAIDRIAHALINWSDLLRGWQPGAHPAAPTTEPQHARFSRKSMRGELAAGRPLGDRHTVRMAAARLHHVAERLAHIVTLADADRTMAGRDAIHALRRLAEALDHHADLLDALPTGFGMHPDQTDLARLVRAVDDGERDLEAVAADTLPA